MSGWCSTVVRTAAHHVIPRQPELANVTHKWMVFVHAGSRASADALLAAPPDVDDPKVWIKPLTCWKCDLQDAECPLHAMHLVWLIVAEVPGRTPPPGCMWVAASMVEEDTGTAYGHCAWYHFPTKQLVPPARNDPLRCRVLSCVEVEPQFRCSRCKCNEVRYCGPACQRADWIVHKRECKRAV